MSELRKDYATNTWVEALSDSDGSSLADLLRESLRRLHQVVDDPDFNYYIHTAPTGTKEADSHLAPGDHAAPPGARGIRTRDGHFHQSGHARRRGFHLARGHPPDGAEQFEIARIRRGRSPSAEAPHFDAMVPGFSNQISIR